MGFLGSKTKEKVQKEIWLIFRFGWLIDKGESTYFFKWSKTKSKFYS